MVHEPIWECKFYVPIRRDANLSDGEVHDPALWEWLKSELFLRFRGWTQAPGTFSGVYEDPDTSHGVSDESLSYLVAVEQSQIEELRKLLSAACLLFEQKCIYLSVAGQVEFIEAPNRDPS